MLLTILYLFLQMEKFKFSNGFNAKLNKCYANNYRHISLSIAANFSLHFVQICLAKYNFFYKWLHFLFAFCNVNIESGTGKVTWAFLFSAKKYPPNYNFNEISVSQLTEVLFTHDEILPEFITDTPPIFALRMRQQNCGLTGRWTYLQWSSIL